MKRRKDAWNGDGKKALEKRTGEDALERSALERRTNPLEGKEWKAPARHRAKSLIDGPVQMIRAELGGGALPVPST